MEFSFACQFAYDNTVMKVHYGMEVKLSEKKYWVFLNQVVHYKDVYFKYDTEMGRLLTSSK